MLTELIHLSRSDCSRLLVANSKIQNPDELPYETITAPIDHTNTEPHTTEGGYVTIPDIEPETNDVFQNQNRAKSPGYLEVSINSGKRLDYISKNLKKNSLKKNVKHNNWHNNVGF